MDAGVTSARSILDKPLTQLTEEDISQLTREDCRKYLKEKGMRRPSWNKSQAIQQVISLKALLETSEDSGAGALRKILVSKPVVTSNSVDSAKEPSDTNNLASVSVDDIAPCRQNDSPKSGPPRPLDCQLEEADNTASGCRNPKLTDGLIGQMTIFYSGKVNVYDGVPPDKAQAIMHLAASPLHSPLDDRIRRPAFSFPYQLQTQSDRHVFNSSSAAISDPTQTEKMTEYSQQCKEKGNLTHDQDVENQMNRKISLQRYLEKKKDRGRFKVRKNVGPTSSSLEVYFNHNVRTHTSNEQPTRSSTSSPPHPVAPHTSSTSADDQMKISFSVDLNEDIQEL
ncbi:protein TIFY 4B isoform X1 [Euphorbia lathyris]|uniref:protein TIFY 4B isoform X1 n=2 Tax=Euphorbia lathyris TaxID=212925 RepID=UPI003314469B